MASLCFKVLLVGLFLTHSAKSFVVKANHKTPSCISELKPTTTIIPPRKQRMITRSAMVEPSPIKDNGKLASEVLSGLVVALATIPTSIAYSTIVGVSPLIGIWTSVIIGSLVAIIRGGPGVITGAAGVVAVPMGALAASHGSPYVGAALLLAGFLEALFGVARLGKLVDMFTEPVVAGFLNAFALFLVKSQIKVFKQGAVWLAPPQLQAAVVTAVTCIAVINGLPKVAPKLPAGLVGVVISTILAQALQFPVKLLADIASKSTFSGGLNALPSFIGFPSVPFTLETLKIIAPVSFGIVIISIVETLLAARIVRDMIRKKGSTPLEVDSNRLSIGLGVGNAAAALFGGFGGCGLIPNSILNVKSGGEGYASSLSFALILAASVLAFAPVIGSIPLAALAGLMLNVAWNTVEWKETKDILSHCKRSTQDFFNLVGMLVTMGVCYKVDMGLGVLLGLISVNIPKILPRGALKAI